MEINDLIDELNGLDSVPSDILKSIRLIKEAIERELKLPRQIERDLFNKMAEGVMNLIAKGDQQTIMEWLNELHSVITEDQELNDPFSAIAQKQRFGIHLNHIAQMLSVYLRSDLEAKDYARFMSGGKDQDRLRDLVIYLFEKPEYFIEEEINEFYRSSQLNEKTLLKFRIRDLDELISTGLITKIREIPKPTYQLSAKAFYYKKHFSEMQQEDKYEDAEDIIVRSAAEVILRENDETAYVEAKNDINPEQKRNKDLGDQLSSLLDPEPENNLISHNTQRLQSKSLSF